MKIKTIFWICIVLIFLQGLPLFLSVLSPEFKLSLIDGAFGSDPSEDAIIIYRDARDRPLARCVAQKWNVTYFRNVSAPTPYCNSTQPHLTSLLSYMSKTTAVVPSFPSLTLHVPRVHIHMHALHQTRFCPRARYYTGGGSMARR